MKKLLCTLLVAWLRLLMPSLAISQPLNNPANVDRTAMSFFDGMQTFRALEYTVDASPQSDKVYRLQTLPENGFPAINLYGYSQGASVYFEDKVPHNDQYTDNPTPYLSSEAVQILSGFQRVMKAFDQKFGWKGSDGAGTVPIDIWMKDQFETGASVRTYYIGNANGGYFGFERNLQDTKPFQITTDAIAHEMTHSIIRHKTGFYEKAGISCSEYVAINEGICNIFAIYIKNKINNSSPQNYNWSFDPQILSKPFDTSNPKSREYADTYNGQYYPQSCVGESPYEAAGIASRWFYLLSAGFQGTAQNDLNFTYSNLAALGVEKAIKIVWGAIPSLKSYSNFPAFKTFTLQAAEQLHGKNSVEYQAVEKAWCAVGVSDNNLPFFSIHPPNAASNIEPWPGVKVNFSWDNDPRVKEVTVEFATKHDFSGLTQTVVAKNFDTFFKPGGGGVLYFGSAIGYYHPGETVYVRAKITQADANFCKGFNPLCKLFQQFGPTHAFTLNEKKTTFWHATPQAGFSVNAWDSPSISWVSVPNAEKYTYQVATDKNFTNLIYTGSVNHTGNFSESGIINADLETNKYYYTRVRAERKNSAKIINNFGTWSKIDSLKATIFPTSVIQALNQKANDPATPVSNLGFAIDWYPVPGTGVYIIEVATDNLFSNIVRSQTVANVLTKAVVPLPSLANLTNLFVRVRPKKNTPKGPIFSACTNIWRILVDQNTSMLAMTSPPNGTSFPFKAYLGVKFEWAYNTVNPDLIAKTIVEVTEKGAGVTRYELPGKPLQFDLKDQLMFDNLAGIQVRVGVENALKVASVLSLPFDYAICPDHPFPKFPSDIDKIDPSKAFTITWDPSLSIQPADQYLVTFEENGVPVNGLNNAPVASTSTSLVVPAGKLGPNKIYSMKIKNSGSCPALDVPTTFVHTTAGGSNNPPATPTKKLDIKVLAYRHEFDQNDPLSIENSDFKMGFELFDPNGVKMNVLDVNLQPLTELLVDSENSVLGINAGQQAVGKYTLKLTILDIFNLPYYNVFDPPRFSVQINGQTVIDNHIIKLSLDATNEWQPDFHYQNITLDHK